MSPNHQRHHKRKYITWAARNEITEYHIYSAIAKRVTDPHNRDILQVLPNFKNTI